MAARFVDRVGGFTLTFLPTLLVAAYGVPLPVAGLVGAAFGLATIPSRLLGGRLSDRIGRRAAIVLGLAGCAAAQLLLAAAPGLGLALLGAVVLGLCFEIYEPPSQALLADLTQPDQRVAAYSALGAAVAAAGVVAGSLAALLAGVGLRWLFVLDAATCLACAAVVRCALPAGRAAQDATVSGPSPWRDQRLRVMLAAGTGFATVYMAMMVGLPLALHSDDVAPGWAGVLLAVSAVTVIVGRRHPPTRHRDTFARMRTGYTLMAAGLVLAAGVALVWPAAGPLYIVPVVVWSLGDAVLLGEPFAVVAGIAPPEARSRYLAAYGVSWGIATTAAPLLATGLVAAGGSAALWGACAVGAIGLAAVQGRVSAAMAIRP